MIKKILILLAGIGLTSNAVFAVTANRATDKQGFNYGWVTTSPYLGLRPAYDGSDLLINLPSMNEDLRLLQQKQKWEDAMKAEGKKPFAKPVIELSGDLEGEVIGNDTYYSHHIDTDIDLTTAEFDVLGQVSPWATAFVKFAYDNDWVPKTTRISNSNLFLDRAFITIGNLNKFPVYGSIGQMHVPFGNYANYMISDPVTQLMARTTNRAVSLGYYKTGFYAQAFAFKGDTYVRDTNNELNNWGANAGYEFKKDKYSGDFGASFIFNLADSEGMQNTNADNIFSFQGFRSRQIDHRVPAFDVHGMFTYNPFQFIGEYLRATRSFDNQDLNFNNNGTTVSALDAQARYLFNVVGKPSYVAVGYGQTWQALALNLPKYQISATLSTSIWRNTIEALEFRHDIDYKDSDHYTALDMVNGTGASRDSVILKIGLYF